MSVNFVEKGALTNSKKHEPNPLLDYVTVKPDIPYPDKASELDLDTNQEVLRRRKFGTFATMVSVKYAPDYPAATTPRLEDIDQHALSASIARKPISRQVQYRDMTEEEQAIYDAYEPESIEEIREQERKLTRRLKALGA